MGRSSSADGANGGVRAILLEVNGGTGDSGVMDIHDDAHNIQLS